MRESLTHRALSRSVSALLARAGRSKGWLAAEVGRSPAWLSGRLSGRTAFDTDDIDLIAQALGVDPFDLLSQAGELANEEASA